MDDAKDVVDVTYIDRLVNDIENNGEGDEGCEEWSDNELEYDSDETAVDILAKDETVENNGTRGNMSEEGKALLLWRLDRSM